MATFDRKFDLVHPTMDRLSVQTLEVADAGLLDPSGTSPVPLIDGEFVQEDSAYKWIRAVNDDRPVYAVVEWRGDSGIQASRKLAAIKGGTYEADTLVFDAALTTLGAKVMLGTVNNAAVGGVNRAGLVAYPGSPTTEVVLGYVTKLAGINGGRLRFLQTLV